MSQHRNIVAHRPGTPLKRRGVDQSIIASAREDDVDGYAMAAVEECRTLRVHSLIKIFHAGIGAKIAIHVDSRI